MSAKQHPPQLSTRVCVGAKYRSTVVNNNKQQGTPTDNELQQSTNRHITTAPWPLPALDLYSTLPEANGDDLQANFYVLQMMDVEVA
jgi:hypothetical protein